MKTRIKKLIDEHVIHPLANLITKRLQEELEKIMTLTSEVKAAVDDLKQAVVDEHARIDAEIDVITKKLEAKSAEHDDEELTEISSEVRALTAGLKAFHPAAPADQPTGDTPPPSADNAGSSESQT